MTTASPIPGSDRTLGRAPSPTTIDYRRPIAFVVIVLALAALVAGLWVWLSPPVTATVTEPGQGEFDEGSVPNLFGGVAVFAFLSFGLGVVLALASWFGLRSMRGVPGLLLTTVIAIVASGLSMDLGTRIAKGIRPALDENVPGDYELTVKLWFDSDVSQPWLLLICAPIAALLVYLVCVLTAKNPTLQPDAPAHDWTAQAQGLTSGSGWRTQGGELVGHPQAGVGEGVQAWRPAAGPSGAPDSAGGHDHPAPGENP